MKKTIAIVGGGSSALMLGCTLDPQKFDIHIYEKNAAPGRKFLVAGDGGLNLTHSESPQDFITRYTPFSFLETSFRHFSNLDFAHWMTTVLGVDTFVGTSGRVFPQKGIKPVEVLNAFLAKIKSNGATIHTKHTWKGFSPDEELMFETENGPTTVKSDLVVFCLGGASWPVTGSKGDWRSYFEEKNISVKPFEASNCYFKIDWPEQLIKAVEGKALKNCSITCKDKTITGEVVVTKTGMEGSGIYPLSPQIRSEMALQGYSEIKIDFKPALNHAALLAKVSRPKSKGTYTDHLAKQLNLNTLQLSLLKNHLSKEAFLDPEKLVAFIKNLKLRVTGIGPMDDAISTVGGICLNEIDAGFELKKMAGVFVIGEMLDYDAPTGGYLLQSCFTMAKSLADDLNLR